MEYLGDIARLGTLINDEIIRIQSKQTKRLSEDRLLLRFMRNTGFGVYDTIVTQALEEYEFTFYPVEDKLGITNITSWEFSYGKFKMLAKLIADGRVTEPDFTDFSCFTVDQLIAYTMMYIHHYILPKGNICHKYYGFIRDWPNIVFMSALKSVIEEDNTLYKYSANGCRRLLAKTALAVIKKTEFWGLFTKNNVFRYQLMMKAAGLHITPGSKEDNFLLPILLYIYATMSAHFSAEHRAMLIRDIKVAEYLTIHRLNNILTASPYIRKYFRELSLRDLDTIRSEADIEALKLCREHTLAITASAISAMPLDFEDTNNPLYLTSNELVEKFYNEISDI